MFFVTNAAMANTPRTTVRSRFGAPFISGAVAFSSARILIKSAEAICGSKARSP